MSETTQNTGTLTWFAEGGFYWLDGELTNQLQLYPVKKMDWDDGITDHSGAPEKLVFGDVTFTKLYEDDNVYQTNIIGAEGAYSLMDIDGTGYYTGFMGSPLQFSTWVVTVTPTPEGEDVPYTLSLSTSATIIQLMAAFTTEDLLKITVWYAQSGVFKKQSTTSSRFPGGKVVESLTASGLPEDVFRWTQAYPSSDGLTGISLIAVSRVLATSLTSANLTLTVGYEEKPFFFQRLATLDLSDY